MRRRVIQRAMWPVVVWQDSSVHRRRKRERSRLGEAGPLNLENPSTWGKHSGGFLSSDLLGEQATSMTCEIMHLNYRSCKQNLKMSAIFF